MAKTAPIDYVREVEGYERMARIVVREFRLMTDIIAETEHGDIVTVAEGTVLRVSEVVYD